MSRCTTIPRFETDPWLRVVSVDADGDDTGGHEGDPVILPFPRVLSGSSGRLSVNSSRRFPENSAATATRTTTGPRNVLWRAQVLHANRQCPSCGRAGVVPLDLGDGDARHAAMPVPGTSTLVGFLCDSCGVEWSA